MHFEKLVVQITSEQVKAIKRDILNDRRQDSDIQPIKSSHITEALARALGFAKQASLKAVFADDASAHFVEFDEKDFWNRLSELTERSELTLRQSLGVNLSGMVSKATGTRDLRQTSPLAPRSGEQLNTLFSAMAEHGVARYVVDVGRTPKGGAMLGHAGFFRLDREEMRPAFRRAPDWWESQVQADALMAGDVLEDHMPKGFRLNTWAAAASKVTPFDVELRRIVFSAQMGLTVEHGEIDGCRISVLHQSEGQLARLRAADERKLTEMTAEPA